MKRRWIFWLLIIIFLFIVISRITEIEKLVKTLAGGQWEWVLIAALLQMLYYFLFTASYQAAFWTVEVKSRVMELLPVTFAAIFVNVAAPSANVSGMALWADDAARRGQSPARTTAGTLLQLIGDFITFTLVLFVGMVYLFTRHDLQTYEIIAAILMILITTGLTSILAIGLWRSASINRILFWLQNQANRLAVRMKRVHFLPEGWAEKNAAEFSEASIAIARYPGRLARMLGILLAAHIVDLSSLYALFVAFHNPVSLGVLVAGYAMGILFWIVSPTPQGIGVVEGVMPLVFSSLAVPPEVATTVSLAFRGLTFWLPLWIGFVLLRRIRTFGAEERSISESVFVKIFAILTALLGLVNVLLAVRPTMPPRIEKVENVLPLIVKHGGHLTSALSGFALILLARGLWRRKRVAWWATLLVLVVTAIIHSLRGPNSAQAIIASGMAVWLLILRDHFHARSDTPSIQQGLRVLVYAIVFTLCYGVLGFFLLDRHYTVNFGFWAALRQTIIMFTQFYDPGLEPLTGFGRYFAASIYIVGLTALGYAFLMLLRPVFVHEPASMDQRAQAEQIVHQYGCSTMARLTLLDDKSYFFSPGGSVVAYVVKGSIAIALGDPIGPLDDLFTAIESFCQHCSRNDWDPAFYQTLPDTISAYQAAGMDAVCIGHDAVVDLNTFTLEGSANKPLRNSYNHVLKAGYKFQVYQAPQPDDLMAELGEISDEWLTMMHGTEKRFSLGWFDDSYVRNGPIAAIHDPEGWVTAFANIIPEYQRNEFTIDLMRRRREVASGTMDFLFVSLIQWGRSEDYDTFNLGLSSLSGVGEKPEDPVIERVMHFIYGHINQFYNFKGLHEFKEKFHPQWSPRYLIYPNSGVLPVVWLAVVQANSGASDFPMGVIKQRLLNKSITDNSKGV